MVSYWCQVNYFWILFFRVFDKLFSVWFVIRYMPYWHLTYFMQVDAIANITSHFFKLIAFNIISIKIKNVARFLIFVKFMQTFVLTLYTLDALAWNNCNFPFVFCWWLVVQCIFLMASLQSKCRFSISKEVRRFEVVFTLTQAFFLEIWFI